MSSQSRLTEFNIGKKIGKGAFSTVYSANIILSKQTVALKKVNLTGLDPYYKKLCLDEVNLLKQIKSDNVIQCYDSFKEKENIYIVIEFAEYPDLNMEIKKMRERGTIYSERTIWFFFHQICNGLKDMHNKNILHRDLKPSNIFGTAKGIYKIGDLGLARKFNKRITMAHNRVGTEYYMAPEKINSAQYHYPSDIWSLGCLLYEMCTFRSPFYAEQKNIISLRKRITDADYVPFPTNDYSYHLHFFVHSCLKISPQRRPTAVEANYAALMMHIKFEQMLSEYITQLEHFK